MIAAVVGTIVWVLVTGFTGYMIFLIGAGIAFLTLFMYEKMAKGMNIVGVIICLVITCIAIYLSVRFGYRFKIAHELDISMGDADTLFDLSYSLDEAYKMDYIKNMIFSYIFGIGYTAVIMFKKK